MSTQPLEASRPRKIRTTKLVDSALQFKIVGAFLAVACVAALFQVLLTNNAMMGVVRQSPLMGDQLLAQIPGILVRNLAITLGILIPVTMVVGILVTHRIAGPIFNMERYLRRIAAGKPPETGCRLREGDDLRELCGAINAAIAYLSGLDPGSSSQDPGFSAELDEISSLVRPSDAAQAGSVPARGESEAEVGTD